MKVSRSRTNPQNLTVFAVLFLLIFSSQQFVYQQLRGTAVEAGIVSTLAVLPSVACINILAPGEKVSAQGNRLVSSAVRLSVLDGCEGTEVLFLLLAALLAFRSTWRHTLIGMGLGIILVFFLNVTRITSLYFALRFAKTVFDPLHAMAWPILIIVAIGLFFAWWSNLPLKDSHAELRS